MSETHTKIKLQIKTFWGSVLWESERETFKEALQDAVLQDADLQDAVLRGADLQGADLRGAVLRGADLRGADLQDAVLQGADLRGAVLRGADLRGADLQDADLRGAVLQDADLQGAVLRGADLQDAVLRGAVLRGADLQGADLRGAVLRGADLQGAVLRGADLRGVKFENLPKDFINQCSRDILFILQCLKSEVPMLREKLIKGEVDGSQYNGDCACLVGSLAKGKVKDIDQVCEMIPFYERGTHNPGENWFLNIKEGDTPENNDFSKHAVLLCDMVINKK